MKEWCLTKVEYTDVRFVSFLSVGFTTMAVINPSDSKLAKCTYVHYAIKYHLYALSFRIKVLSIFATLTRFPWKNIHFKKKNESKCAFYHDLLKFMFSKKTKTIIEIINIRFDIL